MENKTCIFCGTTKEENPHIFNHGDNLCCCVCLLGSLSAENTQLTNKLKLSLGRNAQLEIEKIKKESKTKEKHDN